MKGWSAALFVSLGHQLLLQLVPQQSQQCLLPQSSNSRSLQQTHMVPSEEVEGALHAAADAMPLCCKVTWRAYHDQCCEVADHA